MAKLQILPAFLIIFGMGNLFITLILVLAWTTVVKVAIPIGLKMTPMNTPLTLVMEVPLSMEAQATVTRVASLSEEGYLAVGEMDFRLMLAPNELEDIDPAIFVEEAHDMGDIQRCVMIPGPLNYGSIFSWFLALGCLPTIGVGAWLRFFSSSSSSADPVEKPDDEDE